MTEELTDEERNYLWLGYCGIGVQRKALSIIDQLTDERDVLVAQLEAAERDRDTVYSDNIRKSQQVAELTRERDIAEIHERELRALQLEHESEVARLKEELQEAKASDNRARGINTQLYSECADLRTEIERLRALLDTPQTHDWAEAVKVEAAHQRERWGADHDAGKTPADWFWLVGYLAGKALHATCACDTEKALHHTISTGAALANWHAALTRSREAKKQDKED